MGSSIPESEVLDFESAARGESHTWRATREFALLGEILGIVRLGHARSADDRSAAWRRAGTVQYADFLGPFDDAHPSTSVGMTLSESKGHAKPRTSFVLVTIPSQVARGVVARSIAALSKGSRRTLGYIENMSGYYCRDCKGIKPLFDSRPCRHQTSGSPASARCHSIRNWRGTAISEFLLMHCATLPWARPLEGSRAATPGRPLMKFLCVPCDSPMKLQTIGPPESGSLSVVYSCPECGYEMAMLTNPYETQLVQSLGVRIGPEEGAAGGANPALPCPAANARSPR